jgi:hypothetical protein
MKRMQFEYFIRNNEDLHLLVPPTVYGFATGWATAWNMYVLPTYGVGNVEVDEFHHYNDWELNLVTNGESYSLEVIAYPYIDEDEQADFSHYVKIAEVPMDFTTDKNNKEK